MNTNTSTEDRVRKVTPPHINQRIDDCLAHTIRLYSHADHETINRRLAELDREWDIERTLQANASTLALTGTLLGAFSCRRWLALPMIVTGFLLYHAIEGWCPPVPVLRRLGVRTSGEIERERYALKALRGDFTGLQEGENRNADDVLLAVQA